LLKRYPLISDQVDAAELAIILQQLENKLVAGERGAVVEFGCYIGTTSLFIRRLLDHYGIDNVFHVYDSFAGLPMKSAHDASPAGLQFRAGELSASKKDFVLQFKKAGLHTPYIHKGWFADLQPADIPDDIMFAYLDGDYYDSIMASLEHIAPKLQPGATIVVDDYMNEALPGAARAVDKWRRQRAHHFSSQQSLAIIRLA